MRKTLGRVWSKQMNRELEQSPAYQNGTLLSGSALPEKERGQVQCLRWGRNRFNWEATSSFANFKLSVSGLVREPE